MRIFTIITFITLCSLQAIAQQQVTVVLKNGKTISGKLLDSVFEDFITLEYGQFERENIPLLHVSGIYFEPYKISEEQIERVVFKRERGFFHTSEFHVLIGRNSFGDAYSNVSLQTINGYAFHRMLMLGIGLGYDRYGDFTLTPAFASIRGVLWEKPMSPFYYLNAGWGFFWQPSDTDMVDYLDTKGGYFVQAGLGYQINLERSAFTLGLGYRLQDTSMEYNMRSWGGGGWDWQWRATDSFMPMGETYVEENRLLRRMVFTLGYTF
jgi:hypothetical protein